jgi:sugar O-acyltransferase (sialic acid O-acetyltransferase NeuD family)
MVLFGSGGHAKVIIDCLLSLHKEVTGIFDDFPGEGLFYDIPVLGNYNSSLYRDEEIIIAIGNNEARYKIAAKISHKAGIVIHPAAVLSRFTEIGEGTVMLAGSVLQAGSSAGKHCIINAGAVVDHDCLLHDFVHIGPNAIIGNNSRIGEGAVIGAGTVIKKNTIIPPHEKVNI